MKRILSAILAICMTVALLPQIPFVYAEEALSGIEIVYPISSQLAYDTDATPPTNIKYTSTDSKGRIEWHSTTSSISGGIGWSSYALGWNLKDGEYAAMKIRVPKEGKYTITQQYAKKTAGTKGNMYILNGDVSDISAALSSATPVMTIDFYGETATAGTELTGGTAPYETASWTAPKAGEYLVVWVGTGEKNSMGRYTGALGDFKFSGGNGKAPIWANSVLSKELINLAVSETAEISSGTVYMSDGTNAENSVASELTFESSDTSVVTVSGNKIVPVDEGKAVIYTKYGDMVLCENEITVVNVEVEMSGITVIYPMTQSEYGSLANASLITYENSGNRIELKNPGGISGALGWERNSAAMHMRAAEHISYRINIPKKGYYSVSIGYNKHSSGTKGKIFILPVDTDDVETAISSETPVAVIDCNGERSEYSETAPFTANGSFEAPAAGEYLVVYKGYGEYNNMSRYLLFPRTMIFNGGSGTVPMSLDLSVSKSLKPSVSVIMSDGKKLSEAELDVKYTSSDEGVLAIDEETGKFRTYSTGDVEVTASTTVEGITVSDSVKLTITGDEYMPYSGVYARYDFSVKSDDWQPVYWKGESAPNTNDIRGITYEYTSKTSLPGNWEWYGSDITDIYEESGNTVIWMYYGNGAEGRTRVGTSKNKWVAFTLDIPASGRYLASFEYCKYYSGRIAADIYLLPKDTADISAALTEDNYLCTFDCLDESATSLALDTVEIGDLDIKAAGEYILVIKALRGGYMDFKALNLDGVDGMKRAELSAENSELAVGEKTDTEVQAYMLDGSKIDNTELKVKYSSENSSVAEVDENGVVTAISEGSTTISARVVFGGVVIDATETITVKDSSNVEYGELSAEDKVYVKGRKKLTLYAYMNSGNKLEVPLSAIDYTIKTEPEDIAYIDEDGYVCASGVGVVKVSAKANFRGAEISSNEIEMTVLEGAKKTEQTLFTKEMQQNLFENVEKYDWAREKQKSVIASADRYVDHYEYIYDHIVGEGVPRGRQNGSQDDPEYYYCRYCGVDIATKYGADGAYAYDINVLTRPWKVQCPDCKRLFPSNDFEKFYKLGLDEHGIFNVDRAHEKNNANIAEFGPEADVLVNVLYPELSDTINCGRGLRPGETVEKWGVDDGFGYVPKKENGDPYKYDNGVVERHTYIAVYNWHAWFQYVRPAVKNLSYAYYYTGDAKYGRAGAIILDRIADVYPGMDMWQYFKTFYYTHGGTGEGKIVGRIQDCEFAMNFAEGADMLYPILEDKVVINFLSEKAEEYNLENKKESAYDIWKNWQDGLLLENFRSAKKANLHGNFGMMQEALVKTAVALGNEPESEEILDFVFKSGGWVGYKAFEVTGGNLGNYFVGELDRDGFGVESSPQYNYIAPDDLFETIEALSRYNGVNKEKFDISASPRFAQISTNFASLILSDSHTVQIGDSQGTATIGFVDSADNLIKSFKYLKNSDVAKKLANQIYLRYNRDVSDVHYDIYTKNPESIKKEVLALADDVSKNGSELLTGYGFGVLREGERYDSIGTDGADNTLRSFWIYSGWGRSSHHQLDSMNIGIEAFGLNLSPDLGYPEATGDDPNRVQWVNTTLSHNTVTIDEKQQTKTLKSATPLHYDDGNRVKVVDMRSEDAYPGADEYRRTLVMIEAPGDISYGIDFFNVQGGNTHIYSFHAQSEKISDTEGLNLLPQAENGEYKGSYAGIDVPGFVQDPDTAYTSDDVLRYPHGYTWLRNVDRDASPEETFSVDFAITDYRKAVNDNKNIHLRMTQVNDFDVSEVAIADGYVPNKSVNAGLPRGIKYALIKREGKDLKSLFTTVFEPYKENRYIESITPVTMSPEPQDGTARAVCVKFTNGRCDYIVYSTDNTVLYNIGDVFSFRGFVGVYSVNAENENIYSYINDGDVIGDETGVKSGYSATVSDFSREHMTDNYIIVSADIDNAEILAGKIINIKNDGAQNGTYVIESAEKLSDGKIKLNIGLVTTVRGYADEDDFTKGYVYNIKEGQTAYIPMSFEFDEAPVFEELSGLSASAGSLMTVNIKAKASDGGKVTYSANSIPRGASLSEDGTITWKPGSSQVGENHFSVTAYDSAGRESTLHFNVKVYGSTTGGTSGGGGGGTTTTPTVPETPDKSETPDVPNDNVRFVDLGNHAWAADAINALAEKGIIRGTSATTYSPEKNITRADFACLLVRAFEKTSDNTENFDDVLAADYFAKELAIARNTGLVGGIGDNKFAPRDNIKRSDMMLMVYRVIKDSEALVGADIIHPKYVDFESVPDYAKEAVSALITAGIVNGKNNLIAPLDNTTRAEVAVLLLRVLEFTSK